MLNIESRVRSIQKDIRKAKTVIEANKAAFYAFGLLDVKWEDGKITEESKIFWTERIKEELDSAERKLYNRTTDKTLDLFRPRKEETRSRKNITAIKGYRKRGIS